MILTKSNLPTVRILAILRFPLAEILIRFLFFHFDIIVISPYLLHEYACTRGIIVSPDLILLACFYFS